MTNLLDHLQEAGYEPRYDGDWFDLTVPGVGTIRVRPDPDDVNVYAFDERMACEWQVTLSPGTPGAVILTLIEAAEGELAAKRALKDAGISARVAQ